MHLLALTFEFQSRRRAAIFLQHLYNNGGVCDELSVPCTASNNGCAQKISKLSVTGARHFVVYNSSWCTIYQVRARLHTSATFGARMFQR